MTNRPTALSRAADPNQATCANRPMPAPPSPPLGEGWGGGKWSGGMLRPNAQPNALPHPHAPPTPIIPPARTAPCQRLPPPLVGEGWGGGKWSGGMLLPNAQPNALPRRQPQSGHLREPPHASASLPPSWGRAGVGGSGVAGYAATKRPTKRTAVSSCAANPSQATCTNRPMPAPPSPPRGGGLGWGMLRPNAQPNALPRRQPHSGHLREPSHASASLPPLVGEGWGGGAARSQ